MAFDLHALMRQAAELRASDIFLKEKSPPAIRLHGRIQITDFPPLTADQVQQIAYSLMTPQQIARFEQRNELDLAFTLEGVSRFRGNVYRQRGSVALVLRLIPLVMPHLDDLGMPPVLKELPKQRQGLILVTGPTGSGKSTTLAALIDHINTTRHGNIITIEDPIEYVFDDKNCVVYQREVGRDTRSFAAALRSVLRQSPDVIMIGEMRDAETIAVAMTASEMGHLVLSSLHTTSAVATVDRIINMFPPHEKSQVRAQLAACLTGVISQRLVRRHNQPGRLPAVEVMINTPTVRKHIEEGNTGEIYAALREGRHFGMNTLNQSLERLYQARLISYEEAIANAGNLTELRQMLRQG